MIESGHKYCKASQHKYEYNGLRISRTGISSGTVLVPKAVTKLSVQTSSTYMFIT